MVKNSFSEEVVMIKSSNKMFWILITLLLFGGVFVNWFEQRGEARVERRSLKEFPLKLGGWRQRGDEIRFGEQTESILKTTDYTMRDYFLPNGSLANVYIGYYESQRTGTTYHSPQNCLPGAGWVMNEPQTIQITTDSGNTFEANRFIVNNGVNRDVLIYWYQGRGRATASEYSDKIYTVFDSIMRGRSDGAMVRVMKNIGDSETLATADAIDLSAKLADELPEFIPD
jgi:EpsI family protein